MQLLILTGTCGVGKTTTAKAWAKKHNGAIIEADYFTEWIFSDDFPHWTAEEEQFTAYVSALLALEYMKKGMSVAIDNVWFAKGIALIIDEILQVDFEVDVKVVWLFCENQENHRRDQERVVDNQMRERVDIVYKELLAEEWPAYVTKIDTTGRPLEAVLDFVDDEAAFIKN